MTPRSKPGAKRSNPSVSGQFAEHLQFLSRDTGMKNTAIIKLAVADLAKSRGFVPRDEPAPRKKP